MDKHKNTFLVYENWRAKNKSVVHKSTCKSAKEGHERHTNQWLINNHASNGRWFGYFMTLNEATAFASILPNRQLQLCKKCLMAERDLI